MRGGVSFFLFFSLLVADRVGREGGEAVLRTSLFRICCLDGGEGNGLGGCRRKEGGLSAWQIYI